MRIRSIGVAAAVAGLVVAGLALPAPAFAAGTGTIIVQLETPAHVPLALSVQVNVEEFSHGKIISNIDGETDSSGRTDAGGIPTSSHIKIVFFANDGYVQSETSYFSLSSGQVKDVSIALPTGATISGNVTEGESSIPLAVGDVALLNSSGTVIRDALTNSSGYFTIDTIPSGTYRLQFNSRLEDPTLGPEQSYGWSYWAGTGRSSSLTWPGAKTITLKQQSSHAGPTVIAGIYGMAFSVDTVNGEVSYWNPANSHAGQHVIFVAKYVADSFDTVLNSAGQLSASVNPGKYKIAIRGDYDSILAKQPYYWYVSDTQGPATSESKGSWVTVDVTNKNVDFIPAKSTEA